MSRIPVEVIFQAEDAQRQARDILGRFANYRVVMQGPVRDLMQKAIEQQYKTYGAFGGTPWPLPLAESTLREKSRHPEWSQEPMQRTGRLMDSLLSHTEDTEEIITKTSYSLGTTVEYAKYHQSTEARTKIPRRPIIPDELPESYINKLRNWLRGYLITGHVAE